MPPSKRPQRSSEGRRGRCLAEWCAGRRAAEWSRSMMGRPACRPRSIRTNLELRQFGKGIVLAGGRVERRLVAILAADIASYSRMVGADELGTLRALKSLRREIVEPV